MFKLILSLAVMILLLPEDLRTNTQVSQSQEANAIEITTLDTLSAAQDVYRDISGFCERNVETCITGKSIATNLTHQARTFLSSLTGSASTQNAQASKTDPVVTGSISSTTQ